MRHSLEGKLALVCSAVVLLTAGIAAGFARWFDSWWGAIAIALLSAIPVAIWAARRFIRPVARTLLAISDGIASIRDRDFSISIASPDAHELKNLVESYNGLGEQLRNERQSLHQRELLLDTVIQATPLAMVLTNATDRIVYSNLSARQLLLGGRKLEGFSFPELLADAPEPLRSAVASNEDTLFTIEGEGESDIYHLAQRRFLLNGQPHRLYLLKELTRELSRQEVETWKKVIRVIAHELNNSLAPISSLAHSGRHSAVGQSAEQLQRIFGTIEDRARHLHTFIDGYARFAKLPKPRPEAVDWGSFLRALRATAAFKIANSPPSKPGVFDPAQMEQVLINLVKNAREAGAAEDSIEVEVQEHARGWRIQVLDRGSGMRQEVLHDALLPFYSTKSAGAGLGLTICREVIEAHGGRIALSNRPGGGLAAMVWIPGINLED